MPAPTKRLVIEIEDGLVARIIADGVDLTDVTAIIVDRDTEGARGEGLTPFGAGKSVFFHPEAIEVADDEYSRDVRRAYDTWSLS